MQTKTYNVYTFDELDEKAKEKARDWYRQGNEYDFLSDAMTEYAIGTLEASNIKTDDIKVYYSLSYSQGDGAMIEMTGTWGKYNFTVKHFGHYYHYNSKTIELWDEGGEVSLDADDNVYTEFNDLYISLCQDLAKYGYDYIEHEDSAENVDEAIEVNEYTFLVDGTRHD